MPLTALNLIAPEGEIERALFPSEDAAALEMRLQTYLTTAYTMLASLSLPTGVDLDEAARVYAYFRAYQAVHLIMSRTAATASIDGEASRSFLVSQIEAFETLRDKYEQLWQDVLVLGDEPVVERRAIDAPSGVQQVIPIW